MEREAIWQGCPVFRELGKCWFIRRWKFPLGVLIERKAPSVKYPKTTGEMKINSNCQVRQLQIVNSSAFTNHLLL